MLGNVLDLARIENNKVEMEYTVSNVHECFENCVIMFQQQAESKNQTLSLTEQIMYPYVYMDAPHLSEICFNIISNAIKYTNTGGKITCNVVQESCKKEDWCNMIMGLECLKNSKSIFLKILKENVILQPVILRVAESEWALRKSLLSSWMEP